ncbi:hypothetical protein EVAR_103060_1 [Eumeta japonica]|uniref:Uncharacterized protein n=1 Tax=Eumeta variegata TaxID=151549 RepID=A0A4C1WR78_EUMVA|nr:hypothetical protein EVAR_103060_1 [Eumeta japonica]
MEVDNGAGVGNNRLIKKANESEIENGTKIVFRLINKSSMMSPMWVELNEVPVDAVTMSGATRDRIHIVRHREHVVVTALR